MNNDLSKIGREKIKNRLEKQGNEIMFVERNKKQRKMSEVLLEFASFLCDGDKYDVFDDNILQTSVLAWNFGLLDEDEREYQILCYRTKIMEFDEDFVFVNFLEDSLRLMIERKVENYNDDRRYIADYQIEENENGKDIQVAYNEI